MKKNFAVLFILILVLLLYSETCFAGGKPYTKADAAKVPNDYLVSETNLMNDLDLKEIRNGTYVGSDETPLGSVKLSVDIENGSIADIHIISDSFSECGSIRPAFKKIPASIKKSQSLDVDAVTGATVSSNSIKFAIFKALSKAKKFR